LKKVNIFLKVNIYCTYQYIFSLMSKSVEIIVIEQDITKKNKHLKQAVIIYEF